MKLIDSCHFAIATQIYAAATTKWDNQNYLMGNAINVKNYGHLSVLIIGGITAAATGSVTLICAATKAACVVAGIAGGTSAYVDPLYYYACPQSSEENDTWVKTAVASSTSIIAAMGTAAHENYIIELDTAKMSLAPWIAINVVGSGSAQLCGVYILSAPRYINSETAPTVLS